MPALAAAPVLVESGVWPFTSEFTCEKCGPTTSPFQLHLFVHDKRIIKRQCGKCHTENVQEFKL